MATFPDSAGTGRAAAPAAPQRRQGAVGDISDIAIGG
jgi:hypothetical protein